MLTVFVWSLCACVVTFVYPYVDVVSVSSYTQYFYINIYMECISGRYS